MVVGLTLTLMDFIDPLKGALTLMDFIDPLKGGGLKQIVHHGSGNVGDFREVFRQLHQASI